MKSRLAIHYRPSGHAAAYCGLIKTSQGFRSTTDLVGVDCLLCVSRILDVMEKIMRDAT